LPPWSGPMECQKDQTTMGTEHNITSPQTENRDLLIHEQSSSLTGTFEALGACDDIVHQHVSALTPVDDNASSNHDKTDNCCQRDDLSRTASPSDLDHG
jgi:hypothetical protein